MFSPIQIGSLLLPSTQIGSTFVLHLLQVFQETSKKLYAKYRENKVKLMSVSKLQLHSKSHIAIQISLGALTLIII